MLLLDYWPLRRWQSAKIKAQRGKVNEFLHPREISAICPGGGVRNYHLPGAIHGGAVRTFAAAPFAFRLSNALVSYAKYLLLTFWPHNLAVYYPLAPAGIPVWQIIGAAFLLTGITAFCLFQRRIRPYLIVGWLWFLGTLVPVIGLVQVGGQIMADRYFYIPSIGLFIALVFGLAGHRQELSSCARAQRRNSWRSFTDPCHSYERADSALARQLHFV